MEKSIPQTDLASLSNYVVLDFVAPELSYRLDKSEDFFPLYAAEGMILWSAKVPKALRQSARCFHTSPIHIKKTAALCFVQQAFNSLKFLQELHKTTAF